MSEHIIEYRPAGRYFRERARGDTTTPFWTYHRDQATRYPTKADAERRMDAMCSCLTRHDTYAIPAREAMMGRAAA